MQFSEAENKAAGEMVDLLATKLGSGRAVHSETAIASAARLAGSLLFRSFNLNVEALQPGTIILSNEANEEGPQLVSAMSAMLQHFGVALNCEKLGPEPSQRGGAPELSVVESLALLQEEALHIARSNGLELQKAALAAAMATAFVVKECAKSIGAEVGFNIAAYAFVEGCKTVPPALSPRPKSPREKTPWYKRW